jgi:hypothetical protein
MGQRLLNLVRKRRVVEFILEKVDNSYNGDIMEDSHSLELINLDLGSDWMSPSLEDTLFRLLYNERRTEQHQNQSRRTTQPDNLFFNTEINDWRYKSDVATTSVSSLYIMTQQPFLDYLEKEFNVIVSSYTDRTSMIYNLISEFFPEITNYMQDSGERYNSIALDIRINMFKLLITKYNTEIIDLIMSSMPVVYTRLFSAS